ncbi:MAG: hypothetical protein KA368_11615, partial [Acidobacteria bacterium]|nr:hypothetical protein [Acidobacteriota bacterium]
RSNKSWFLSDLALKERQILAPCEAPCHYPNLFSFAPEAQRRLAGGETTGNVVVIALRPGKGAGPKHSDDEFRSSKFRPAPLPGCNAFAFGNRWFHHRLISTALSGQKAGIAKREKFG